jgi:hypothetical protein
MEQKKRAHLKYYVFDDVANKPVPSENFEGWVKDCQALLGPDASAGQHSIVRRICELRSMMFIDHAAAGVDYEIVPDDQPADGFIPRVIHPQEITLQMPRVSTTP